MKEVFINETKNLVGKEVELYGWIHVRRDHGKLIFIDLRDRSGVIQVVFVPSNKEIYELAKTLRSEWVVRIKGKVNARPEKMINAEIETGKVEFEPSELEVLNESLTPPFALDTSGLEIGEDSRMKYRYLDLRRPRMANNLTKRHQLILYIRNWLDKEGFIEIETPILTKSTPEGARDYVVPSRLYPGRFFALPQSPQQYKQLLMASGVEKYFQIARCFRDEDTRGDRQPEFTQLDLEMSFVERENVMDVNERLLIDLVKKLYPEKEIQEMPFPKISYNEAVEKYGTDRPDLRKDNPSADGNPNLLAFCWVIDFPFFEKMERDAVHSEASAQEWTFTHNPFSAPKPEFMQDLLDKKNIGDIITSQYDIVLNGWEIGGGSIRNHKAEALEKVFEIMGFENNRIQNNFGHMMEAFRFGTPPHGGIAWGLDRLVALLHQEPNIREVMAFPKTGDARDLLMESPSEISLKQLRELRIKIDKVEK
jgi:aspartyl-tRNA synthetase